MLQFLVGNRAEVSVDEIALRAVFDRGEELMIERCQTLSLIVEVVVRPAAFAEVVGVLVVGFFKRRFRLHVPHIFLNLLRADFFVEIAVRQEQGRPQVVEREVAACALYGVLALAIAVDDAFYTLGGNVLGIFPHFNKDKFAGAAICLVHVQNSMGGRTGTGEGIEDN